MDKDSANLIEWLKSLPENAVVKWNDDSTSREKPWTTSWMDVQVPEFQEKYNYNWAWTIFSPNDEDRDFDEESVWCVTAEPDLDFHGVYNPNPPDYWYAVSIVVPKGQPLNEDQIDEIDTELAKGEGRSVVQLPAWSIEQASRQLHQWTAEYAERPDIHFEYDFEGNLSPLMQQALDVKKEIEAGTAKTYKLDEIDGWTIQASDQFMDFLLELPDEERSKLSEEVKKLVP